MKIKTLLIVAAGAWVSFGGTLARKDIHVRDPFVFREGGKYHLVSAAMKKTDTSVFNKSAGVQIHTSDDLENWSEPKLVFAVPEEWNCRAVWAPELHKYKGKYYLFATMNFDGTFPDGTPVINGKTSRGTWILRSDNLFGPYTPMKNRSHTPQEWLALDGTLWVEDGVPYMVFCHEWCQVKDGTMEAVRLTDDLTDTVGAPRTLFKASAVSDVKGPNFVTDGPFVYRGERNGTLNMIWSTFIRDGGYCVVNTRSRSGTMAGPWDDHRVIAKGDGGHGMIFTDNAGKRRLSVHRPNKSPHERMRLTDFSEP